MKSRPYAAAMPPISSESRVSFEDLLNQHLEALQWSVKDLSRRSGELSKSFGLSEAQIFGCLQGKRSLTKKTVSKIAITLVDGYEKDGTDFGMGAFDLLLNQLLQAAGFPAVEGHPDNRWQHILNQSDFKNRRIRVGWFEWGNFAKPAFEGPSRELTKDLCRLLQIDPDNIVPVRISSLEQLLEPALFAKVDLLAPFLDLPTRHAHIAFSRPIFNMSVGQNVLTHRDNHSSKSFDWKGGHIHVAETGLADVFLTLAGASRKHLTPHDTIQEAWKYVADHPTDESTGLPSVFVGDEFTCRAAAETHPDELKLLLEKDQITIRRNLVFGLPPRADDALEMVDDAIGALEISSSRDDYVDSEECWGYEPEESNRNMLLQVKQIIDRLTTTTT